MSHRGAAGVLAGVAGSICCAGFQMVVKGLTRSVASATIVIAECALDSLILLPLALVQTVGAGYVLSGRDVVAAVVLAVVCTAIAYTIWTEGVRRISVQHAAILGFLTPVAAPVFAFALLGQSLSLGTLAGGALIAAAGLLVARYGREEPGPEPPM